MNWLIISSVRISPPSPANVLTMAPITSLACLYLPTAAPYAMPGIRKHSMMMNSREAMNGVCPMMSPVCGSRSGAPGGRVHSSHHGQHAQQR